MNELQRIEKQRKINTALIKAREYVNGCENAEAFVVIVNGSYEVETKTLRSAAYEYKVYFQNGIIYVEDSTAKQIEPAKKISRKLQNASDAVVD